MPRQLQPCQLRPVVQRQDTCETGDVGSTPAGAALATTLLPLRRGKQTRIIRDGPRVKVPYYGVQVTLVGRANCNGP